jgi:hypothetical protein
MSDLEIACLLHLRSPLFTHKPLPITRNSSVTPLGLFLAFSGFRKHLTNWEAGWAVYRGNDFSPAEYRNTAVIEVIGGLGMVFPRTKSFGAVILISMIVLVEIEMKRRKADRVNP